MALIRYALLDSTMAPGLPGLFGKFPDIAVPWYPNAGQFSPSSFGVSFMSARSDHDDRGYEGDDHGNNDDDGHDHEGHDHGSHDHHDGHAHLGISAMATRGTTTVMQGTRTTSGRQAAGA